MSPDPPENHQGTAAASAREAAPVDGRGPGPAAVEEFFGELGPRWLLTVRQRRRLTPAVRAALAAGWEATALVEFAGANTAGVRNPYAVLAARLSPGELPAAPGRPPPRLPWCGRCDSDRTRHVTGPDGRPARCPHCHPLRAAQPPA